jgi:AraC-like DNA-binding protein
MHVFYRKALTALLLALSFSGLAAYLCVSYSYLHESLLAAGNGPLGFTLGTRSDNSAQGRSTIRASVDPERLDVDYTLSESQDRHAAASLLFHDAKGALRLVDLSRYNTISFNARCSPANTLSLAIPTFDDKVSKRDNWLSYRTPYAYFSCGETSSRIELDLTRMAVPQWWFDLFHIDLWRQGYKLDAVPKIEFGNSFRSPSGTLSRFEIEAISLNGRDRRYLVLLGALMVLTWGAYAWWFLRGYGRAIANDVRNKVQRDMPLVAYQQLSIEPHRDKEKSTILRVVATRYADPEFDLDTLVQESGANRNKVNDILKAELGYTFSTYLNKLRLTEAARLLSENEGAAVGEIAYSVGYKNVTYFNRLFKEEYNCTPKAFREICKQPQ